MGTILQFKSCAYGGEYTGYGTTPTNIYYGSMYTPDKIGAYIKECYKNNTDMVNVEGIGYGWQKYTVPYTSKLKFSVRGAAGGTTSSGAASIDPVTGKVTGSLNRPGRGAKIEGSCLLNKGSIIYILVGCRGWSSNGTSWGSGGGGASVVLLDNPSGSYTFTPVNRKVDVLFVAGGGAGAYVCSSIGSNRYGNDADIKNGTSTGAGISSHASGGAGLTAGSSGGDEGNAYAILSGNPSTASSPYYGGWGGGGVSWNGGGGGGGYSGGNASDSGLSNGGTSYINPTLCTETFRGYATLAQDSNRNLENPWTAYGFVEIELGRSPEKYILAKDSDGYKYFNGTTLLDNTINDTGNDTWELLPNQSIPTQDIYETYGKYIITSSNGLQDKVRFLVSSINEDDTIDISGKVNKTIVETKDTNTSDIDTIKSTTFTGNTAGATIKFAVSKDSGATWQTYSNGAWKDIDVTDKDKFLNDGCYLDQITTIPVNDWKTYLSKTLRFKFIIDQNDTTGNLINEIKFNVDLLGSWMHFKESQAQYEYISDTELKITFLEAGDYKVNYLDKIS